MLKISKEIECYDKVMELHPNYSMIKYNLISDINKRLKNMFIKMKPLIKSEK